MNRLALAIGTWFGCGYFPWGPGTVGSLAGVLIAAALHADRLTLVILLAIVMLPGIWASTQTARILKTEDPGMVVVDEVLGQWVTLLGATALNWKAYLLGFVLFRLFDIWKPWPVRKFEDLPEGTGIVADDLAAGVYGAALLYISGRLGFY